MVTHAVAQEDQVVLEAALAVVAALPEAGKMN
jgi:hypothetical protein